MLIEIPDHYAPNVGGAMVERAVDVINRLGYPPAYLHQFADLWEKGLHYGGSDVNFWTACSQAGADKSILRKAGLL